MTNYELSYPVDDLKARHDELRAMGKPTRHPWPDGIKHSAHVPPDQVSLFRELQSAWDRFSEKYAEYEPGAADETGLAGQWADMFRKVRKLKRALWEGETGYLTTETVGEILDDLLGHVLLAKEMLARDMEGGRK